MEQVLYGIPDMPEPRPGGIVYGVASVLHGGTGLYYPLSTPTGEFMRYLDEADTPLEVKGTE